MSLITRPQSRRRFIGAGALTILATALAACSSSSPAASPTQPAASSAPANTPASPAANSITTPAAAATKPAAAAAPSGQIINLRFWTYYEATARASQFPALIKKYEDANPGIKIDLNAGFANYSPTVHTAMLGGDPADLLGITQYDMREYQGGNLLADLTDTVKQSGLDQKLYPAAMAGTTMSGKVWGLTDALRFGMWFYNPTAFKELNLQIPSTYTDLVGISKTIRNAGKYPILWGLKDLSMATNVLQVIIPQVVGTSAILKASAAKNYNVPELVPVLDMFRKMVDDKILDQSDTGITGQDARAMLGKGDSLMYPSASYDIGNIIILKAGIDAFKEPVLLVDKPVVKYWGGIGQCYCIAKASKQFDATAKFLLWWFQPEQLKVQIEKSGLVSSEPEANTAITDPLSKFAVANLDKVPEDGLFWNNYVPTAESQAWGKAVQAVVNKQRTPQQALQDIQAVFNK